MNLLKFLKELLKDKSHHYSMREFVIAVCLLLIVLSWIAKLLFDKDIPEYMFYAFISLVATGCFGYSIEKNNPRSNNPNNDPDNNNLNP